MTITITTESSSDAKNLLRLMAWMSPAFPVGSFSYSHGLERAVHDGLVTDKAALGGWILALLRHGSAWNDAVLLAEAWRRGRCGGDLGDLADLAEALAGSVERHLETVQQGTAFMAAAKNWPSAATQGLPGACAYCVTVGATAGAHDVPLADALAAFLQAFTSNLLQAGIRLGVTGQQGAVALLAVSEPVVVEIAARAERSTLDDLGACTVMSDIMAMRHETQYSRLFRS